MKPIISSLISTVVFFIAFLASDNSEFSVLMCMIWYFSLIIINILLEIKYSIKNIKNEE